MDPQADRTMMMRLFSTFRGTSSISRPTPLSLHYRLAVGGRVLAAVVAGYALAAAAAAALGLLLSATGTPRAVAVMTATQLSFVVHACAVLWVFACGSARRAWLGLLAPALALSLLAWLLALGGVS